MRDLGARGLRQALWHEPQLTGDDWQEAWHEARALARDAGMRLIAQVDAGQTPPAACAGSGLHLSAAQLRAATRRPAADWLGAGVQSPRDLALAAALGCDFAVWEGSALAPDGAAALAVRATALPIYLPAALGLAVLSAAQAGGAHGLLVEQPHSVSPPQA